MAQLDLADLAAVPLWSAEQTRAAGGRCAAALVHGWRDRVNADVATAVLADLTREGLLLEADADGRIEVAAWLRLHDHLASHLCHGDRVAFGQLWLAEVAAQVPWLGRAGLRALGLRGALRHLPAAWAAGFDLPAPKVEVAIGLVSAAWTGHAAFAAPTFRWLIGLQGALIAPLCGNWPGVCVAAAGPQQPMTITWHLAKP